MHLYVHLPQLDQHYKLSTNFTHHKITLIHTYWAQMASDVTLVDVPWMSVVAFWMPTNLKRLGYTQKEKKLFRFICSCIWRNFAVTVRFRVYYLMSQIFFILIGPTPASFIIYFRSFQTNIITIFATNICEKNVHPVYGIKNWTHNLRNVSLFP